MASLKRPTDGQLKQLRRWTIPLSRMRVLWRIAERFRRRYARDARQVAIDDFDGDLTMHCELASHVSSQIFWFGCYSRDQLPLLDRLLQPDHIVLDIGANEGEQSVFAAKRVPRGHVFAFEPSSVVRERLSRNIAANALPNITVLPIALSDKPGRMTLFRSTGRFSDGSYNDGMNTLHARQGVTSASEEVTVDTVDGFIERERPPHVDLIKIDVEGAEWSVLAGARATIAQFRPLIILEVENAPAAAAGHTAAEILNLVRSFGYTVYNIGANARLSVPGQRIARDVLCAPADRPVVGDM
jgi:FkbM family methyltransferase